MEPHPQLPAYPPAARATLPGTAKQQKRFLREIEYSQYFKLHYVTKGRVAVFFTNDTTTAQALGCLDIACSIARLPMLDWTLEYFARTPK